MDYINLVRPSIAIALLLASFGGQAELFKWVDKNGKTHYSDKDPGAKAKSNDVETIKKPNDPNKPSAMDQLKALKRPPGVATKMLHLRDIQYFWNRASESEKNRKVGVYHIGKGCTSRGAIKMPGVFARQRNLFPKDSELNSYVLRLIKELDYPATDIRKIRDTAIYQDMRKHGLVLQGEIIDVDYHTCARQVANLDKYEKPEYISVWEFSQHRLELRVNWLLKLGAGENVLFQTISTGHYSDWKTDNANWKDGSYGSLKTRNPPERAFAGAMTTATMALFSDPEFLKHIASN